jgi:hypothetical protein
LVRSCPRMFRSDLKNWPCGANKLRQTYTFGIVLQDNYLREFILYSRN